MAWNSKAFDNDPNVKSRLIEYKVREIKRYVITRHEEVLGDKVGGIGSTQHGEFTNEDQACAVADALAFKEREDFGWPPGDERIQFADRYKTKGA